MKFICQWIEWNIIYPDELLYYFVYNEDCEETVPIMKLRKELRK